MNFNMMLMCCMHVQCKPKLFENASTRDLRLFLSSLEMTSYDFKRTYMYTYHMGEFECGSFGHHEVQKTYRL